MREGIKKEIGREERVGTRIVVKGRIGNQIKKKKVIYEGTKGEKERKERKIDKTGVKGITIG